MDNKQRVDMDTIVSLSKRRGFVFPSSEIYGGFSSTWDYGPLGVELKRNIKNLWWRDMTQRRDDVVGLDSAILMSPLIWQTSGHVTEFTDPMVDCKSCKRRFRADQIEGDRCPECGGELTEMRRFNLMFKTFVGPVEDDASVAYLRPETAQGIFVNFFNVQQSMRRKLPFGIAQVGKSFRNEITPGNFIFRTREFEQMEMEFFVKPGTDEEWHRYWIETRYEWYLKYGLNPERLRIREHAAEELAHYAKATSDVEYNFPWGWAELEGIANRTDFDLRRHSEASNKDLSYFDDETKEHIMPYVIEPAAGPDRIALTFLVDAYHEEPDKDETRVVLRFHPEIAPIKVAVLPLSKKLAEKAHEVHGMVRQYYVSQYDDTGSIGKRYRRQDEIGTPLCVTIDFDTLEDQAVTVRDRDTMEQVRVPITELMTTLSGMLKLGL
ncbi:MAG: glycyl-tRNA synthetase [Chloroflexia bacterium]|jgi:glycyl-tRNA synthetase|nr:glycyl-tRNA synthetase [Chloroflexia bacterium]